MGPSMIVDGEVTCSLVFVRYAAASMGPSMIVDGELRWEAR